MSRGGDILVASSTSESTGDRGASDPSWLDTGRVAATSCVASSPREARASAAASACASTSDSCGCGGVALVVAAAEGTSPPAGG